MTDNAEGHIDPNPVRPSQPEGEPEDLLDETSGIPDAQAGEPSSATGEHPDPRTDRPSQAEGDLPADDR